MDNVINNLFEYLERKITVVKKNIISITNVFLGTDELYKIDKECLFNEKIEIIKTPEVLFIDPTDTQPQESHLSYVKLNLVGGLINYF